MLKIKKITSCLTEATLRKVNWFVGSRSLTLTRLKIKNMFFKLSFTYFHHFINISKLSWFRFCLICHCCPTFVKGDNAKFADEFTNQQSKNFLCQILRRIWHYLPSQKLDNNGKSDKILLRNLPKSTYNSSCTFSQLPNEGTHKKC